MFEKSQDITKQRGRQDPERKRSILLGFGACYFALTAGTGTLTLEAPAADNMYQCQ
jgi:hypothetical protein